MVSTLEYGTNRLQSEQHVANAQRVNLLELRPDRFQYDRMYVHLDIVCFQGWFVLPCRLHRNCQYQRILLSTTGQ